MAYIKKADRDLQSPPKGAVADEVVVTQELLEENPELAEHGVQVGSIGKPASTEEVMLGAMTKMMEQVEALTKKVDNMEKKDKGEEFKLGAKTEDLDRASASKTNVDQRIVSIVEQILGDDFTIAIQSWTDRPGYLFTLIVPPRLSEMEPTKRPILDRETGLYKVDPIDNSVLYEVYTPEDRRSRAISSTASFDAIKDHCERVRSNIIATFQKLKKPIPEFRLKI